MIISSRFYIIQIQISPLSRRTLTYGSWRSIPSIRHPMSGTKRAFSGTGGNFKYHGKKPRKGQKPIEEGSNEAVLYADVKLLLEKQNRHTASGDSEPQFHPTPESSSLPERFSEIEVTISDISSTGDGLGLSSTHNHVYVVPFTLPGDVVRAKTVQHFPDRSYTLTDFLSVVKPSPSRHDELVRCPYFAKCGGCQLQMLPYEEQLKHKKTIIEKAYRNFSNLLPEDVPPVGDTIGSPLEYEYRTKLTPHFDRPPGSSRRGPKAAFTEVPPIGFLQKGTRKTIDIEQCPIGTPAVQEGLRKERKMIADEISKYRKGATILLRESTERTPKSARNGATTEPTTTHGAVLASESTDPSQGYTETKTYVTDNNAITTEYVGSYKFTNPAGAFFQNNNSILPTFTDWIRQHILHPPPSTSPTSSSSSQKPLTTLLDTFSGSGLFTITLSPLFTHSLGIDISPTSISSALTNLSLNNIACPSRANFLPAGDASNLFATAIEKGLDPDETVVVVDPPRKGCDEGFLRGLRAFGPRRVVYVSCNVHTQARDVGRLCAEVEGDELEDGEMDGDGGDLEGKRQTGGARGGGAQERVEQEVDIKAERKRLRRGGRRYKLERLQGFDFFPQTGHVESVALLDRVEE